MTVPPLEIVDETITQVVFEKIHKKASNRTVIVHNAPSVNQIQDLLLTIPSAHQDIIERDVTHLMLFSVKDFATKKPQADGG